VAVDAHDLARQAARESLRLLEHGNRRARSSRRLRRAQDGSNIENVTAPREGDESGWNNRIRKIHRWTSIGGGAGEQSPRTRGRRRKELLICVEREQCDAFTRASRAAGGPDSTCVGPHCARLESGHRGGALNRCGRAVGARAWDQDTVAVPEIDAHDAKAHATGIRAPRNGCAASAAMQRGEPTPPQPATTRATRSARSLTCALPQRTFVGPSEWRVEFPSTVPDSPVRGLAR
jgi:hypothetical protein